MGDGSFMTGVTMVRTMMHQMEGNPYIGGGSLGKGHRGDMEGGGFEMVMIEGKDVIRIRGPGSQRLISRGSVEETHMSGWIKPNTTSMFMRCPGRRGLTWLVSF